MRFSKKWILVYTLFSMVFLAFVYAGSRAVTVISQSIPVVREHCIIIDAGHGGVDGGATSCTGKLESAYNLEIAITLNDLINLLGYETKMIRTTDISVYTEGESIAKKKGSDLKERVRIVNEENNAVLLSIHQNHFPDSRYSGAQVFYPNTNGSKQLAESMQQNLVNILNPGSRRTIMQSSGIYLMEHIQCTGILIECGFLSNPGEEAKLSNKEYQQNLCAVIGTTVGAFLSNT